MVESEKVESRALPEPKDLSKGEIYKYQKKSHPEVQKWQSELERRRLESKASLGIPPTKEENSRVKRLPVLSVMIPYISSFVGSLIKPLIGELIHRPQQASQYNQNLIRRFLPKIIKNTH